MTDSVGGSLRAALKLSLLVGVAGLAACGGDDTPTSSAPTQTSSSAVAQSSVQASSSLAASSSIAASSSSAASSIARPVGPPVQTDAPNASGQNPAFPEQTRAPEVLSDINLNVQVLASGENVPWGIDFLPDGRILMTLRNGGMRIVTTSGDVSNVTGTPALYTSFQGGLLDVKLAPDFASSRMVYFSYSENRGNSTNGTTVARARLSNDESRLENTEVIFRQMPAWNSQLHFGSRLVWADDGNLYVTLGERSLEQPRQYAQRLDNTLGKVVRITADGGIPSDNPFVNTPNAAGEIWSYGHRNVQGAALHPQTRELWTIEHGPRGGDEINIPEAGLNYGWPTITYGEDYSGAPIGSGITSMQGMEQPAYYWDPVIAPSDMTFYTGDLFPEWKNNLFIASLNPGGLVRLMLDGKTVIGEERLLEYLGRVRDVAQGPDGALYATSDNAQYSLVRITPR